VKETQWGWELLNDNKALWPRSANDIDEEEYDKFFQAISKVCHFISHATRACLHCSAAAAATADVAADGMCKALWL
jgi:HSP90 family molecular chaperone